MKGEEKDPGRLRRARNIVRLQTEEYWDMLAETNQLHGNVPEWVLVRMMYSRIAPSKQVNNRGENVR